MPLPCNRWFPAFYRLLRLSAPSFNVPWPRRQFPRRTQTNTHYWVPSNKPQGRAFRSSATQRGSSVSAHPTGTSPNAQLFVKDPFTILFCGRDRFSCTVFKEVYNAKDVWGSLHIATNPDVKAGRRSSRLDISPLKMVGETLDVPVYTIPGDKAAFKKWLPPPPFIPHADSLDFQNASHLLITASFGRILPAAILRLFPNTQRLNVHPSLLPQYRGPAPIQRMLMAGEQETGVCVIEMGEVSRKAGKVVDAGRIWAGGQMDVPDGVDFLHMQEALATTGGKLLVNVLRDILLGRAQSRPQEAIKLASVHAPLITAKDSAIHFASQTALVITRLERAIGHQRSLTVAAALPDERAVAIAGLQTVPTELGSVTSETERPGIAYYSPKTKSLVVKCAEGTWLSVERLQTQDRAMLEAKEWWNGVKGMGWVQGGLFRFNSTWL